MIRAVRSEKHPEGAAVLAEDSSAEWFMDYHNADGSVAEMCGNGIRVFAAYLIEQGLTTLAAGDTLAVGTRAGVRDVQLNSRGFQVDLGRWRLDDEHPEVRARDLHAVRPGLGLNVGNPHVVVAIASADELAAIDLTVIPIVEPTPVDGANVEFVVPSDPLVADGVGRITMRVHERGSGETLSCGTGAAAAALATRYWAGQGLPTSGASMFPAAPSASACSRPKTASTCRSVARPNWSSRASSRSDPSAGARCALVLVLVLVLGARRVRCRPRAPGTPLTSPRCSRRAIRERTAPGAQPPSPAMLDP
ncbi:hypothetical protein GCM10025867_24100 [Frondihabitans sucicola]|uniref:Diaminopimelate epimerase n=1 Tax=Frondihabitans sucicola TaxID=1268041 RepID=A0ABN6XZ74_9MICO|nr:hypothetical protein GCM10025867_24100 [Frondihabitans sucicola]